MSVRNIHSLPLFALINFDNRLTGSAFAEYGKKLNVFGRSCIVVVLKMLPTAATMIFDIRLAWSAFFTSWYLK